MLSPQDACTCDRGVVGWRRTHARLGFMVACLGLFCGCLPRPIQTMSSTDPDFYEKRRVQLRSVSMGDWTLETWGVGRSQYQAQPIEIGMGITSLREVDVLPKVGVHLKLRRASDGAPVRDSHPIVEFGRWRKQWRGEILDAFLEHALIPVGEYLLDIEVVIGDSKLTVNDVVMAVKENEPF